MSLYGSKFYTSLLVLGIFVFQVCQAQDLISLRNNQDNPKSDASSSSVVKLSSVSGVIVGAPKDGLSKRDIKVSDLSGASSGAITAKSYDPPPEFYRGPGSTSASVSPSSGASASTANGYNNNNRDSATAGFVSKPIAFPGIGSGDAGGRNKFGGQDNNPYLANAYNNWQQLKGTAAGLSGGGAGGGGAYNSNNIHDRISVGHYGSAGHNSNPGTSGYSSGGSSSAGASSGGGGSSYAYEAAHHPAYYEGHTAGHYGASGHGGGGASGSYYGGSSAEGIPFDVYGTKHGASGVGHYAGAGGEYSYTYPDLHAEPPTHKGPGLGLGGGHGLGLGHGHGYELSSKALLAKSFLIPLASAAVLGIAAALVSNPLLLQLGTVSGVAAPALIGKRKRRELAAGSGAPIATATVKKLSTADLVAYRGQRQRRLARV